VILESTISTNLIEEINPKEFYGTNLDTIQCLEDKLESEFYSFYSTKKPVLWPGMAFNLSVPGNLSDLLLTCL